MIQEIELEKLKIHPRNVRKTYHDIEELADSIKAQGILQNLTVVPDPDEDGTYLVVIGNRRLTAARLAGIKTAPCYIAYLNEKEQASMMLLENMQRNDLTITEQSQGFQMVLDLGETEDNLAEKTGFSRTTIRRRLNIAKLDQDTLIKRESDHAFQLNLTDLYELEKVPDLEMRNKFLGEAENSQQLAWKVKNYVSEEKRKKAKNAIFKLIEKAGIKEIPDNMRYQIYDSSKVEKICKYSLDDDAPEELELKKADAGKLFYYATYREIEIVKKAKKSATGEKVLSPEELERKQKDQNKKKLKEIFKEMIAKRGDFVKSVIENNSKPEGMEKGTDLLREMWLIMMDSTMMVSPNKISSLYYSKDTYSLSEDEQRETQKKVKELKMEFQFMIMIVQSFVNLEPTDWKGHCNKNTVQKVKRLDDILAYYGFTQGKEDGAVLNGTNELYVEEKEEDEEE